VDVRAMLERRTIALTDIQASTEYPEGAAMAGILGVRAIAVAPMIRGDHAVGAIALRRQEAVPVTDLQLELLQTFAAQAAIAVENVRLFNETKEALEQQTAAAEILKVISRSTDDIQPVLDIVCASAARLTGAEGVAVFRREGDTLRAVAAHEPISTRLNDVIQIGAANHVAVAARAQRTVHIADVRGQHETPQAPPLTRLSVPIVTASGLFGVIALGHREVQPFTSRRDRDRERAPLQRDEGGPRAADRDRRHPSRDLGVTHGHTARAGGGSRECDEIRRSGGRRGPPRAR
jgi:GAF domain-containing protein